MSGATSTCSTVPTPSEIDREAETAFVPGTEPIQHLYNEGPLLLVATQGERLADVDEADPGAIAPACRAEVPLVLQEVPQRLVNRSAPGAELLGEVEPEQVAPQRYVALVAE